jgi:hypothetical protein
MPARLLRNPPFDVVDQVAETKDPVILLPRGRAAAALIPMVEHRRYRCFH